METVPYLKSWSLLNGKNLEHALCKKKFLAIGTSPRYQLILWGATAAAMTWIGYSLDKNGVKIVYNIVFSLIDGWQ